MTTPTTTTTPAAGADAGGGTAAAGATAPTDAISQALALEATKAAGETKTPPGETKTPAGETKQPAAETKPAEGEKKDAPKEGEKKDGKPVELALKVPEGFEVDKPALDAFKAFATKNELKPEVAQGVFDQYVAIEKARVEANEKAFTAQDTKWVAELKADPELGGEKWPATVKEVRAGLNVIGRPFGELIAKTGLGNNPVVVRELVRIGRANADDTIKGTEKPASGDSARLTDAELFYGKKPSSTAKEV